MFFFNNDINCVYNYDRNIDFSVITHALYRGLAMIKLILYKTNTNKYMYGSRQQGPLRGEINFVPDTKVYAQA